MANLTKVFSSVMLGFVCCLVLAMPVASAESLWTDNGSAANLFTDRKARAVGDSLMIIISENSSANRTGTAANTKSTSTSLNAGIGLFGGIAAASAGNADKFAATGSLVNSNNVSARMTAQVTEIKPNGSLMITGKQSIKQNGEEQTITVSGVVRIDDITPDNTVLSSAIGNAEIKIDGKGPLSSKQRQGIITQLFNIFF